MRFTWPVLWATVGLLVAMILFAAFNEGRLEPIVAIGAIIGFLIGLVTE